jgi:putative transposase
MIIQPLTEGNYFHIYNRGINGEDIFKGEKNYYYFLEQYKKYCSDVFDTYAYALLKNHFHLLVYVKENVIVKRDDGKRDIRLSASKQLSHLFNSYAPAMNKCYNRTGSLFESPFERKLIGNDSYITSMIYYCHYNAQLHGMVENFKDWPFSSYHSIREKQESIVAGDKVLEWFGGWNAFEKQHDNRYNLQDEGLALLAGAD